MKPLDIQRCFDWAESQDDLSREDMLAQLKEDIETEIKSACEFYLKYKNRTKKFMTDFPEYAENIILLTHVYDDGKRMIDYNDWLFQLAFKDVLGDKR